MKKVLFFLSLAALLTGCGSNDFSDYTDSIICYSGDKPYFQATDVKVIYIDGGVFKVRTRDGKVAWVSGNCVAK